MWFQSIQLFVFEVHEFVGNTVHSLTREGLSDLLTNKTENLFWFYLRVSQKELCIHLD